MHSEPTAARGVREWSASKERPSPELSTRVAPGVRVPWWEPRANFSLGWLLWQVWGSAKLVTSTGSLTPRRVVLKAKGALRRISCRYMQMNVQMPASSNIPTWPEGFANFIEDAAFQFQEKLKSFPVPITVSWYRQQNTLMCTQHSVLYICDLLSEFSKCC